MATLLLGVRRHTGLTHMVFNFDVRAIWRSGLFYVTILATLRIKGLNWAAFGVYNNRVVGDLCTLAP